MEIQEHLPVLPEARTIYSEEEWFVESGDFPEKAWYKIQNEADNNGCIKHFKIGDSRCMLFKINDVLDLYKNIYVRLLIPYLGIFAHPPGNGGRIMKVAKHPF